MIYILIERLAEFQGAYVSVNGQRMGQITKSEFRPRELKSAHGTETFGHKHIPGPVPSLEKLTTLLESTLIQYQFSLFQPQAASFLISQDNKGEVIAYLAGRQIPANVYGTEDYDTSDSINLVYETIKALESKPEVKETISLELTVEELDVLKRLVNQTKESDAQTLGQKVAALYKCDSTF